MVLSGGIAAEQYGPTGQRVASVAHNLEVEQSAVERRDAIGVADADRSVSESRGCVGVHLSVLIVLGSGEGGRTGSGISLAGASSATGVSDS